MLPSIATKKVIEKKKIEYFLINVSKEMQRRVTIG
jgi:hypothetical protein